MNEMVFSEFTAEKMAVKFDSETAFEEIGCVGSVEQSSEVKKIVKKCKGMVSKTRTIGTGNGELKTSLHMPYAVYTKMYGMDVEGLKDGVKSYGQNSTHPEFCSVMLIEDEDGNKKYKAYPRCIINNGPGGKIENGAEEVAEIEPTISFMPDEHGQGEYEVLESEMSEEMKEQWMTAWSYDLVKKVTPEA